MSINISEKIYRPEINGLRAIAVLGVILNHLNTPLMNSGYLGVDIFFVISGYVITSSLSNKKRCKNFWHFFLDFYSRRLKRIIPALLFYVLIISLLVCFIVPEKEVIIRTGITSLFGLSNFYLLKHSTDYFAQTTELNPFTHTWSLSVEEQFYFLFPIIIWFTGFAQKTKNAIINFKSLLLFLSTLSVFSFIIFYYQNLSTVYFLMPFRFWELSIGALAFLYIKKLKNNKNILLKISPEFILICILFLMTLPEEMGLISTLLIVVTTFVLLLSIKKNSLSYKLLTNRFFLFIGSLSYSLYLWHWGIISLSKWLGFSNSLFNTIIILTLTLLISIFSYLLIENKFRYHEIKNVKTLTISFASIIFSSMLIYYPFKKFIEFTGQDLQDIKTNKKIYQVNSTNKKCNKLKPYATEWTKCEVLNSEKNSIILLTGDSMSRSLMPLARKFFDLDNFDFVTYSETGTLSPPIRFITRNQNIKAKYKQIENQKTYLNDAIDYVQNNKYKNKYLWIFNDMNFYFYGREWQKKENLFVDDDDHKIKPIIAFDNWLDNLEKLTNIASEKNIKILYFGSLPSIQNGYEVVCAKNSQSKLKTINNMCKDNVIKRRSSIQGKFIGENLENKIKNLENYHKNFIYIDTAKTFCSDLNDCEIYEKGKLYMSDSVHISQRKAIDLYPLIKSILFNLKNTK